MTELAHPAALLYLFTNRPLSHYREEMKTKVSGEKQRPRSLKAELKEEGGAGWKISRWRKLLRKNSWRNRTQWSRGCLRLSCNFQMSVQPSAFLEADLEHRNGCLQHLNQEHARFSVCLPWRPLLKGWDIKLVGACISYSLI